MMQGLIFGKILSGFSSLIDMTTDQVDSWIYYTLIIQLCSDVSSYRSGHHLNYHANTASITYYGTELDK